MAYQRTKGLVRVCPDHVTFLEGFLILLVLGSCKNLPQLEKNAATGGQRETRDQTTKSLNQNKLRDESSPICREREKESRDVNGRYHLRQPQRTHYGEKRETKKEVIPTKQVHLR